MPPVTRKGVGRIVIDPRIVYVLRLSCKYICPLGTLLGTQIHSNRYFYIHEPELKCSVTGW
jgi:hypothetical protein